MNMKSLFLPILIILIASTSGFAQKKLIKKADDTFNIGEYTAAYEMYEKAYEKLTEKPDKARVAFQLGECARRTNNVRKAKKWYKYAVKYNYKDPMSVLYYAQALMSNEDYELASGQFERYKQLVPNDIRGANGIKACEEVMKWRENPTRHIVEIEEAINSKQSDFSPSYGRSMSELYFSSTRESAAGDNSSKITGEAFADIFVAVKDNKDKWSEPVPAAGLINTKGSQGTPFVMNNGATMYYTHCKQAEGENHGCKIYKSRKTGDGWGQPELVKIIADSSISVAHPTLSKDELTIYFVSDMEGGQGGKDIWVSKRTSATGKWGKPKNLGAKINTPGDEVFPFLRDNGELYFASNGQIGAGGLDIFKAVNENGTWTVTNMKLPINSSADDFGIIFYEDTEEGYFTSARKKTDDIYHFEMPPLVFTLKGLVTNSESDSPLPGATVKLVSSDGGESEVSSASDGTFVFRLSQDMDYTITASRKKFLAAYKNLSTRGIRESQEFNVHLDLGPIKGKFELPNVEYDVGKATLRPESMASLDKLVEILTVNPNITIELIANTDFRGSDADNLDLSQRRAQSVVDYLLKKGIEKDRLTPVGKGESNPRKIDGKTKAGRALLKEYSFLKDGDVLSEEYIKKLTDKTQIDICHQLNRRTEFGVLRDDYGLGDMKGFGE